MSRQHPLPRYVIAAINDARMQPVPRIADKEIDIYLYETNQPLRTINESPKDTTIIIQSKLKQILKFRYSAPNTEITTPKFENPADSAYWLNQLRGFIFEKLDVNPNTYSYITINIDTTETIKYSQKFRIVRNNETLSAGDFRFSEIVCVQEGIKSFPSFDKANYELVDQIKLHDKIKRIQITLEKGSLMTANGLQIFTKKSIDEATFQRNSIQSYNNPTLDCQISFINFLQINPLIINFISQNEMLIRAWKIGRSDTQIIVSLTSNKNYEIPAPIITDNSVSVQTTQHLRHQLIGKKYEFFDSDKKWIDESLKKGYDWTKNAKFIVDYLNGQSFDEATSYIYPEVGDKIQIADKIVTFKDLDYKKQKQRQYFIMTQHFNFQETYGSRNSASIGDVKITTEIIWRKNKHYFTNSNKENWQNYFNKEMFLDISIQRAEYSPKIIIKQFFSNWLKIAVFNESNEKIFEGSFNTNNSFNDSNFITTLQL